MADPAVKDVGDELNALGDELFARRGDVVDVNAMGSEWARNSCPNAVGSMSARVRLPAWNSTPGMSPQRLTKGRPRVVP